VDSSQVATAPRDQLLQDRPLQLTEIPSGPPWGLESFSKKGDFGAPQKPFFRKLKNAFSGRFLRAKSAQKRRGRSVFLSGQKDG
jgi:hypothetical protein